MIVYRKKEEPAKTRQAVTKMRLALSTLIGKGSPTLEDAREALMEWGIFEAAVADALCQKRDAFTREQQVLRLTGLLAGHALRHAWEQKPSDALGYLKRLKDALGDLSAIDLPEDIILREPEGYAHYGLFPETYIEAAKNFCRDYVPDSAAVIGIRSIGVSLSSAVASVLEASGWQVESFTVRPRSHPFNRRVLLGDSFERYLAGLSGCCIIVDEGPGISGTSLCAMAEKLSTLGVDDRRIIFFPSWVPDGANLFSPMARARWARHEKYACDFHRVWVKSKRLANHLGAGELVDISAGGWRSFFYGGDDEYPAVNMYHERRKFLSAEDRTSITDWKGPRGKGGRGDVCLVKFAGFGSFGREKYERAVKLYEAGFTQRPYAFTHGFIVTEFVRGDPVRHERPKTLLERMASYLSFIKAEMPAKKAVGFDQFAEMIVKNTALGAGKKWAEKLDVEAFRGRYENAVPVAVDGRMLPHEWLRTDGPFMKADAIDHHADQFFPGCQDIAWDIAGAIAEFGLTKDEAHYLVSRYEREAKDDDIRERLGFYRAAYPAFRLGYCFFAADGLKGTKDGERFKAMREYYAGLLRNAISELTEGSGGF